jgi:hypothetical protein
LLALRPHAPVQDLFGTDVPPYVDPRFRDPTSLLRVHLMDRAFLLFLGPGGPPVAERIIVIAPPADVEEISIVRLGAFVVMRAVELHRSLPR